MCRQSCATTTKAMVIETSTAKGAATVRGMRSASNGTANRASPNPNVDRITVARNKTTRMCRITECIGAYTPDTRVRTTLFVLATVLRSGAGFGEVGVVAAGEIVGVAMAQLSAH